MFNGYAKDAHNHTISKSSGLQEI